MLIVVVGDLRNDFLCRIGRVCGACCSCLAAVLHDDFLRVNGLLIWLSSSSRSGVGLHSAGNLVSKSGLDLSQTSGFTVVAEKLNFFRYISHFR
jgi:hypothetical protein